MRAPVGGGGGASGPSRTSGPSSAPGPSSADGPVGSDGPALLLFLTTTCEPCRGLWDALASAPVGFGLAMPVVVVTPSASMEDEPAARASSPPWAELVMSSAVWFSYGVGLAGTAVLVRGWSGGPDGTPGEVLGQARPEDPWELPTLVSTWLERDRARKIVPSIGSPGGSAEHRAPRLERLLNGPPLVPGRVARRLPRLTIVTVALIAAVGFATRNSSRPLLFDARVDAFLGRASGFEHRAATLLSQVGDPKVFAAITAIVALALILLGDYRAAVATTVSVVLTVVVVEQVLKPFFERRMATIPGWTFPSGHTAVAVALAGALTLAVGAKRPLGRLLAPALRSLLAVVVFLVACSVGTAMVALGLHYMTDVIAGALLGLAVTGWIALFVDLFIARLRLTSSSAGAHPPLPQPPL